MEGQTSSENNLKEDISYINFQLRSNLSEEDSKSRDLNCHKGNYQQRREGLSSRLERPGQQINGDQNEQGITSQNRNQDLTPASDSQVTDFLDNDDNNSKPEDAGNLTTAATSPQGSLRMYHNNSYIFFIEFSYKYY